MNAATMSPFASLPKIFLRDEFGRAIRCVNRSHPGTLGGRARMWLARLTEGESTERELRQWLGMNIAYRTMRKNQMKTLTHEVAGKSVTSPRPTMSSTT